MFEQYLEIFRDSFFANFLFTFSKDLAFPISFYFEGFNVILSSLIAVTGSSLGLIITFSMFYIIAKSFDKNLKNNYSYQPFKEFINKYPFTSNFFALLPEASVIAPFISGLAKLNYFKFILYILIFRVIFSLTIN